MKLIDQRRVGEPLVVLQGPHPLPEEYALVSATSDRIRAGDLTAYADEALFARAPYGELESPPGWEGDWGLLLDVRQGGASSMLLAKVYPAAPQAKRALRGRWFLWQLSDGRLLRHESGDVIDIFWCGPDHAIILEWAARESANDYIVRVLSMPGAAETARAEFPVAPHGKLSSSAQALEPLREPHHWIVWTATGHGESGFDVLEVRDGNVRRLLAKSGDGDQPGTPVLSADARWFVYSTALAEESSLVVVDLESGGASTTHAVRRDIEGDAKEYRAIEAAFDGVALRVSDGDCEGTFAMPPPPALVLNAQGKTAPS